MLTVLIIDDEPLARQELQYLLDAEGDVFVVGQGGNGIEAVELIRSLKPDVVFLDVRMPGLDGFAVLQKVMALERKAKLPQIVFATAFDQYAVKAFEVNAVDYLLKPFDSKRLSKTLLKVRSRLAAPPATPKAESKGETEATAGAEAKLDTLLRMVEEQRLFAAPPPPAGPEAQLPRSGKVVVRAQNRLLLVDQKDMLFASIADGRIRVATKTVDGESNCRTLEELMEQLDTAQFWRVHRSHIVNVQHVREVVPWFKSSYQLRMDDRNQTELPVSRTQARRLRETFNL